MSTNHHVSASVRELLARSNLELDGILTVDGEVASGSRAREALTEFLSEGKEVIPCCCDTSACPDFDYTGGGCPGHESKDKEAA